MADRDGLDEVAARHGLSPGAVEALAESLARGGGGAAQWSHPDLGGMGQWFAGGMLQIGDMFNDGLKGRIRAALEELADRPARATSAPELRRSSPWATGDAAGAGPGWWPAALGQPSATGDQNGMRYACFPGIRRLAVSRAGTVTVYDTGRHRLTGFAQAQRGGDSRLAFTGPDGPVALDDLTVIP